MKTIKLMVLSVFPHLSSFTVCPGDSQFEQNSDHSKNLMVNTKITVNSLISLINFLPVSEMEINGELVCMVLLYEKI